ncbi:recombinase RecT [Desulfovibrio sp.]|uniref:recombinase RecT n=1 Tax=Desulfovibrio sp. TaxID=885 RepID=UPI0025B86365|nr:recombinase RecT [Desulfovibrio sp.]
MNAPTKIQPETVGQLIQKQIPAIAMVVGGSTKAERERRAERFARICLTAVRNTPKLANCTMESFAASMMICAQLDLEPNTPQQLAFLIPFEIKRLGITECQFQVGYPMTATSSRQSASLCGRS